MARANIWGNSYEYDAWGNLLQKTVTKCGAENLIVTADAHNWIHASGTDYQYDAAGNMTFNATPPTQTYTYDQENRLTGAAGYAYTYDGDGNRVRKSNGNLAANGTLYWPMTPGVVAETDLAGILKSEYVFFDGERVARKDFPSNSVAYYFSDNLKTASVITDSAGVIKAESDYYPWGGELQFVNNDSNDYKFTGKKRDIETGLDYFGARYYSNGLGRWVSADWSPTPVPIPYANLTDPQSLNLYGYVRGLPTTKADIDGHGVLDWLKEKWAEYKAAEAAEAKAQLEARQRTERWRNSPEYKQFTKDHGYTPEADEMVRMGMLAFGGAQAGYAYGPEPTLTAAPAEESVEETIGSNSSRLPQDAAVNPKAPTALPTNRPVGPSPTQNAAAQADIQAAKTAGASDIRVNQQQVNAAGQRVGINRPDVQHTDASGTRIYTEYGSSSSTREAAHQQRIHTNDPNGKVILRKVD